MTNSSTNEMTQLNKKLDELNHLNEGEYESQKTVNIFQYFDKIYTTTYGTSTFPSIIDTLVHRKYAQSCSSIFKYVHEDVFKNEQRWHVVYYLLHSLWNFTDQTPSICSNVVDAQFVPMLLFNLNDDNYLKHFSSNDAIRKLFDMIVSILHNIVQIPELAQELRRTQCVEILNRLTSTITPENIFLKGVCYLTLSYLIREDEHAYLTNSNEIIPYLTKLLALAVKDEDRRSDGLQTVELCRGLSKLSVANGNKFKIFSESELVESLLNMLGQKGEVDEQIAACTLIWNLAFDENAHKVYKAHGKLNQILTDIAQAASNDTLRRLASGCLFTLMGGLKTSATKKSLPSSNTSDRRIMISYNHDVKQMCKQIKDRLSSDGYRVWIDFESMHGNLLDAMADAIESSSIFVLCLTERYKDSPSCRLECEYAYQRNKYIIPLLLQQNYKPDGWLGLVVGTKYHINYTKKSFETAYAETVTELKEAIAKLEKKPTTTEPKKVVPSPDPIRAQNTTLNEIPTAGALANLMTQLRMDKPSEKKSVSFANWEQFSITDTQRLLANNGFEKFMPIFMEMDGPKLNKLLDIKIKAPQCFYMLLKDRWDQINAVKEQNRENSSPTRSSGSANSMAQFLQLTIALDRLAILLKPNEPI